MKTIVSLFIGILFTTITYSQGEGYGKQMEQIKAEQVAYLTLKLDLTVEEAQRFWPVFNEYIKKKEELIDKRRMAMHGTGKNMATLTEKEKIELANAHVDIQVAEAMLIKEYHERFMKVLPIDKVLEYYRSEHQFKNYMFKKYKHKTPENE